MFIICKTEQLHVYGEAFPPIHYQDCMDDFGCSLIETAMRAVNGDSGLAAKVLNVADGSLLSTWRKTSAKRKANSDWQLVVQRALPSPAEKALKKEVTFPLDLDAHLEAIEKDLVFRALELAGNNKKRAAELLGIKRTSLWEKLKRWGVAPNLPTVTVIG